MARQYEPIWNELKSKGSVRVAAPKPLHKRIVKAVLKEKYNDVGYKLLLAENNKHARIETSSVQSTITFKLIKSIGTDDL